MDTAEGIDLLVGIGDAGKVAFVGSRVVQQFFTGRSEGLQLPLQVIHQLR